MESDCTIESLLKKPSFWIDKFNDFVESQVSFLLELATKKCGYKRARQQKLKIKAYIAMINELLEWIEDAEGIREMKI